MKLKHLIITSLVLILLSTFITQKDKPFKHIDGILKIFRDNKGVPRIVADSR